MSELERDNVFCRLVKVDVASHSPQMTPLASALVSELSILTANEARIPLWSTVLGRRARGQEFDAGYWGRNLRDTVRFTDAINGLLDDGVSAFVELGPHPILLHSIAQTAQSRGQQAALAACGRREEGDHAALFAALGQLWAVGYPIDWRGLLPASERLVSLPLYPWQRERHWIAVAELDRSAPGARAARDQLDEESLNWLFDLRWEASDLPAEEAVALKPGSCWLVISAEAETGSAIASALRSGGASAETSSIEQLETAIEQHALRPAAASGIIAVAPDGPNAAYLPVRVLQAATKAKWRVSPKLWFATRGGQPVRLDGATRVSVDQAALWGAARVVGEEHPDLWGGLVDFDPLSDPGEDPRLLVRHLASADGEDQTAFRGGRRYVLRLVPAVRDLKPEPFAWRQDAAYLITGGLGDIGLQIARSLAARGVRRLVLMGRTPLPPRQQWSAIDLETPAGRRVAAVRALEAEGVSVHVAAVDVSEESQIRDFLDRYKAEAWPPIRGVIHAAVSLENSLVDAMDRAAFEKVVGTKLRAAQLFDELLPDLDVFVLFSSMGGFLPHPGIANYSAANVGLDALAYDRRARGLPAVSIAWGPWQGTGLAGGSFGEHIASEFTRQGIQTLAPERCTKICAWLCNHADPFTIVFAIDWEKFRNARAGRDYPIFKNMLVGSSHKSEQGTRLGMRLAQAAPAERRKILEQVVRIAVGTVLKIAPSRLDARKVMGTMGLNSLMAMELRNRLEAELERPLSATLAWNYPTIEALVAYLADAEPPIVVTAAKEPTADISEDIQTVLNLSDEQALAALRGSDSVGRN
jgi:acyl transferase domain-containing protein/acyl carrier protein